LCPIVALGLPLIANYVVHNSKLDMFCILDTSSFAKNKLYHLRGYNICLLSHNIYLLASTSTQIITTNLELAHAFDN
jgi:hypothetical protein